MEDLKFKPTSTDIKKEVILEDRDYMVYIMLNKILNKLEKIRRLR